MFSLVFRCVLVLHKQQGIPSVKQTKLSWKKHESLLLMQMTQFYTVKQKKKKTNIRLSKLQACFHTEPDRKCYPTHLCYCERDWTKLVKQFWKEAVISRVWDCLKVWVSQSVHTHTYVESATGKYSPLLFQFKKSLSSTSVLKSYSWANCYTFCNQFYTQIIFIFFPLNVLFCSNMCYNNTNAFITYMRVILKLFLMESICWLGA